MPINVLVHFNKVDPEILPLPKDVVYCNVWGSALSRLFLPSLT